MVYATPGPFGSFGFLPHFWAINNSKNSCYYLVTSMIVEEGRSLRKRNDPDFWTVTVSAARAWSQGQGARTSSAVAVVRTVQ